MNDYAAELTAAKRRNPDAFKILSHVTGITAKRLQQIADGEPATITERIVLDAHR